MSNAVFMSIALVCLVFLGIAFPIPQEKTFVYPSTKSPFVLITGIAQDAGYPQAGCRKSCCAKPLADNNLIRHPVSLSLVMPDGNWYLFEATPEIKYQIAKTWDVLPKGAPSLPNGVFLTHAHIGHYTGLMHLGREVMGASDQVVFALPRMHDFLLQNGPWAQLVELGNIKLEQIRFRKKVFLSEETSVEAIRVPHRDEYSETAAFHIKGPDHALLFVPDIDKWAKWDHDLIDWISKVDYALLDATFYDAHELPGRDMAEIPHPFVVETTKMLEDLPVSEKRKVHFIHLNHTNPLLDEDSNAFLKVTQSGFRVASQGQVLEL